LGSRLARPRVLGHRREEFGEEEPRALRVGEREGFEKKATDWGFKHPRTTPGRTLSGPAGLCLAQVDFVRLELSV
jgi:hypothetical protein